MTSGPRSYTLWNRAIRQIFLRYRFHSNNPSYRKKRSCVVTGQLEKEAVAKYVIQGCYVPAVLQLVHDGVIAGYPGRERTLTAARESYFWDTMRTDIDAQVSECINCAQHSGTVPRPAPWNIPRQTGLRGGGSSVVACRHRIRRVLDNVGSNPPLPPGIFQVTAEWLKPTHMLC